MKNIVLILLLILSSSMASACERTLSFGVLHEWWKPYYFQDNGKPTGSEVDFLKLVFNDAGICYKTIPIPSSERALVELKQGNIDLLFSASYSDERAEYAHFSVPYRTENARIFWNTSNSAVLKDATLAQLLTSGLQGAVNRGSYFGNKNDPLIKKSKSFRRVPTLRQRIALVSYNRVNFAIEDQAAGLLYLKENKIHNIEMHPYVIFSDDVSLMYSKKSVPLSVVHQLDASIKKNKGEYQALLQKYL